jgi:hypothetical protein
MANFLTQQWQQRPWWMSLLMLFCLYMTFVYMPFDIFYKPVAQDEEVWFGVTLHGWPAKLTAPLHWLIYGAGAYGFWQMKRWMWPWAAIYCAQVVIAMFMWNLLDPRGGGVISGAIAAAVFLIPTVALARARQTFGVNQ